MTYNLQLLSVCLLYFVCNDFSSESLELSLSHTILTLLPLFTKYTTLPAYHINFASPVASSTSPILNLYSMGFPIKSAPFGAMIAGNFHHYLAGLILHLLFLLILLQDLCSCHLFIPWTSCETVPKVNVNLFCLVGKFTLGTVGIVCVSLYGKITSTK